MPQKKGYDVIILGTGPAGLQAAIHAARKKVSVLVMGKETKAACSMHMSKISAAFSRSPAKKC